ASSSRTTSAPGGFGTAVTTLRDGFTSAYLPPLWPTYDPGFFPTTFPVPGGGPTSMDQNAGRPGRQYQWSVGIQREIVRDLVVEASYVGNRGIWWQAPGLVDYNAISLDRFKILGLDPTVAADRTMLNAQVGQAAAGRFQNKVPYSAFPTTQTVFQSLRPFPQFTGIPVAWAPLGKSWYDSLQIKVTNRLNHGFSATSTFTWQKNLAM